MTVSEFDAAVSKDNIGLAVLFEGFFDSGRLNLWSGVGDLSWNEKIWVGAGNLLEIGSLTDSSQVSASGVTISLSAIPIEIVQKNISGVKMGDIGLLWLAVIEADGNIVITPELIFSGGLDVPSISDAREACKVSMSFESRLVDLNRADPRRFNNESQKTYAPNDRGFEYVASLEYAELRWGRA